MNISNRSRLLILFLFSTLTFLAGCSSDGEKRPEYMDAYTVSELEIPPKLTTPDTRGALQLPEPAEQAKKSDCN